MSKVERYYNYSYLIFGLMFFSSIVLSFVSPVIAFYYSLSLLVMFPREFSNKYLRSYISIIAIINACIIFSSRVYLQSSSDDFGHYYASYLSLVRGGTLAQYSQGFEFLISYFFKLTIILFGKLSVPDLFFCVSLFSSLTFYTWVEYFGLKDIDDNKKSLCVASCLAFFMYAMSIQLMRQMLATPFLLFALSYGLRNIKGKVFYVLAIGGHLSSLPLYFVLKTYMGDNKRRQIILTGFFVLFGVSFAVILNHLSLFTGLPVVGQIFSKLQYYNGAAGSSDKGGNTFLKYMVVMLIGFFFFGPKHNSEFKKLFLLSVIPYCALIFIPLLSSRIFLLISTVALGYFMFLAFYRASLLYRILLILYFVVRVFTLGPYYDYKNDGFDLWYSYPWIYDYVNI